MTHRFTYSDGQTFDVELASREAMEWFLKLDFPNAVFDGGGDTLTIWENEDACRSSQKPVAVVERAGASTVRVE